MELNVIIIISRALWMFLFTQTILIRFHLPLTSCKLSSGNETDRFSLLAIKTQITGDPFNMLSSWNDSSHFCKWAGVACGRRHRRLVGLDLSSYALAGTLSPHVGNLSFLRILNLNTNRLTQNIPEELGRLFRLRTLILRNNSFVGGIPASLSNCSGLQYLDFGQNKLVSTIPPELGSLSELHELVFISNQLYGSLPSSFGNLSSLEGMWGEENGLSGGIREEMGNLKRLKVLALGQNNLEGSVPPSIFNLSRLETFAVHMNPLTGPIPSDIGLTLPQLSLFQVGHCSFNGSLPKTLSNASNLVFFHVGNNSFSGEVPVLRNLIKLEKFLIYHNNLGDRRDGVNDLEFLDSLLNITSLRDLIMDDNQLKGVLPQTLCNFSKELRTFTMAGNQLRGSIPREIGNLVNLQQLYLSENLLTGTLPESISKLRNLVVLYLRENELSGRIPDSLGNATSLTAVYLDSNTLEGRIPPSVGDLEQLTFLELSYNNLSGMIPKELFGNIPMVIQLSLRENQFTGHLPAEIGELINLEGLTISGNMLSGEIPSSLGSCIVLEGLFLEGNLFEGSIPSSLSPMRGLRFLNLSHNNLSGEIPEFLEDMKLLEWLDLSFNDLQGEVPSKGVFQNSSGISLAGNKRLCGGLLALNLTRCTARNVAEPRSSSAKLKLVLSICGGIAAAVSMAFLMVAYRSWKRKNSRPAEVAASPAISFPQVSYEDLLRATDGFASGNLIGRGSFGAVYRGVLGDGGQPVAVKVLNLLRKGASKSFMAECEALSNIRHRNLVKVITACSSIDFQGIDFKALVYEYIPNGTLEQWLHPNDEQDQSDHPTTLSLVQRLNIGIDMANALQYLHQECETPLVHCDIKPSNIVMDMHMTAHLADFGLARFLIDDADRNVPANSTSSVGVKGTIGYAAPEYGMGSVVSTRGDIYSYGILLLEMITGKRPSDDMFKEGLTVHNFVKKAIPDRVEDVADPVLLAMDNDHQQVSRRVSPENARHKVIIECLASILMVGVACSAESPRDRMDIGNVVIELHRLRNCLVGRNLKGRVLIRT